MRLVASARAACLPPTSPSRIGPKFDGTAVCVYRHLGHETVREEFSHADQHEGRPTGEPSRSRGIHEWSSVHECAGATHTPFSSPVWWAHPGDRVGASPARELTRRVV